MQDRMCTISQTEAVAVSVWLIAGLSDGCEEEGRERAGGDI